MKLGIFAVLPLALFTIVAASAVTIRDNNNNNNNNNNTPKEEQKDGGNIYQILAQFDAAYGGLYAKLLIDNVAVIPSHKQLFDRITFSTRHSRTFLVHGGKDKCKVEGETEDAKFCNEHATKYSINPDSKVVVPVPMKNDMKDKGDYLELGLTIVDATVWVCTKEKGCEKSEETTGVTMPGQRIGLMYAGVARDPKFWGQGKFVDDKRTMETSLADGVFSLWPNAPEDTENFGAKTPLKNLGNVLWHPFVSIKMDQELDGTQSTDGLVKFGAYQFPDCADWHVSTLADPKPWQIWLFSAKIGKYKMEGVSMTSDAVIDTTEENIVMPKYAWTQIVLREFPDDGGCDLTKMPTLEFQIGRDQHYRVRPQDYVRKTGNKCVRLWRVVDEHEPQRWRLGLPFLRNHCVALDLEKNKVWLSADRFKSNDPEPEPTNRAFTSAVVFIAPLVLLLALLTSTTTVVTRWL